MQGAGVTMTLDGCHRVQSAQNIQDPVGVKMLEADEEGVCPNSRNREGTRGEKATTRGTTLKGQLGTLKMTPILRLLQRP